MENKETSSPNVVTTPDPGVVSKDVSPAASPKSSIVSTPQLGSSTETPAEKLTEAENEIMEKPRLKRGPRGPREDPNHPRTAEMVNTAIIALNQRGGSSIQAIKKYMAETFNIDTKKKALFIKKYLISAVEAGVLYRTRGAGAAGSFQVLKGEAGVVKPKSKGIVVKKSVGAKKAAASKSPAATKKQIAAAKKKLSKKATSTPNEEKKLSNGPSGKAPKTSSKPETATIVSTKKTKTSSGKAVPAVKPATVAPAKALSKKK